ncbi:MAG TPA: hypothetical protein VGG64_01635 [Pirellulales bacterium]|jgi:hypothetical protein
MNARDIFGLIVRTAGIIGILHGLPGLNGIFNPAEGYTAMNYLMGYGTEAVGGLLMLVFAEPIAWLSYLGTRHTAKMS